MGSLWARLRSKEMEKSGVAEAIDHALVVAIEFVRRLALIEYVCSLAMSIYRYSCCRGRRTLDLVPVGCRDVFWR